MRRTGMVRLSASAIYETHSLDKIDLTGQFFAEELIDYVNSINISMLDIPIEEWYVFSIDNKLPDDFFDTSDRSPQAARLGNFRKSYPTDKFRYLLGKKTLELMQEPFCMLLYLQGIDWISHSFMHLYEERDTPYGDPEMLRDAIPEYYRKVDEWVGDIISTLPENTYIVICSDHGFDPNFAREDEFRTGFHDYAPNGTFIFTGPGIPHLRLERQHVTDSAYHTFRIECPPACKHGG